MGINLSVFRLFGLIAIITIYAQIDAIHHVLIWNRADIMAGQWWRIVTGNLTHANTIHLAMNLTALAAHAMLHRRYYEPHLLGFMILIMMIVIGIAMFFSPSYLYSGFSGVLHGLFVWGFIRDMQHKAPLGWMFILGIILKLLYEVYTGGDSMTSDLIGVKVAYQAHCTGAMVGLLFVLKIQHQS
ncbi:rhombosortase [Candidatus Enterovibrio escicola]|uniref:rhombosortase n=1 Tax=Candidatus Enterovibrio escicola TaxID=1927127 RepID=UPI0029589E25|nr:rhombosortase [Candidatus Enterovibrio escacola]